MLTVYWASILIGLLFGLVLGIAVSYFSTWLVDKEWEAQHGNSFSHGFDSGWKCGIEHQQLMDMNKENQKD